jgi:hypothetical protein
MSDGHYCIVRDLGLVKGGKGMKHHEVVVDFNRRGMAKLFQRGLAHLMTSARANARIEEQPQLQAKQSSSVAR